MAVDALGNIFVADSGNNKIPPDHCGWDGNDVCRQREPGLVTDGAGTAASFNEPSGMTMDAAGFSYVGDGGNDMIRRVSSSGVVTTLAGVGAAGSTDGTATAASFWIRPASQWMRSAMSMWQTGATTRSGR